MFQEIFPIPSLKSLAFQALVVNNYPPELFLDQLPGKAFQCEYKKLEKLKESEAVYRFKSVKDKVTLGQEENGAVTEKEKMDNFRDNYYRLGESVSVEREDSKTWKIGQMVSFKLNSGLLKRKRNANGLAQVWMDEGVLKSISLMKNGWGDGWTVINISVTFKDQTMLIEELVIRKSDCKCNPCKFCNYTYEASAVFDRLT